MRRWLLTAFLALFVAPAAAQDALVVQTCGTLPQAYNAGATRFQTVDVNGRLCLTGSPIFTGLSVVAGILGDQQNAFSLTATQPASPTAAQVAVQWTITSAGSASQNNTGFGVTYGAGYTGSSNTRAVQFTNIALGTGSTLIPAAGSHVVIGNAGGLLQSAGSGGTGLNLGSVNLASGGPINVGALGLAQVATNATTNIGVAGSAVNGGTASVGGWFSLNRTTVPGTSAALIADIGAQAAPIALWQSAGSTVASVNQTGGLTATLTSATGTNVVCQTPATNALLTVQVSATGCAASSARFKRGIASLDRGKALQDVLAFAPVSYFYRADYANDPDLHVGFTAEQIATVDSQWITYEADGVSPRAVKYNEMAPLLTAAIQQLHAEFEAYKRAHP